jgi:triacylglycerol lipase
MAQVARRGGHAVTRLVFLVPGFFGFTTIGSVSYFQDVAHALGRALKKRGVAARIVHCPTQPTGSIVRRADSLRRYVIEQGGLKARELHFVGHSTGGLDVRMLLTPGVSIAPGDTEERLARRTRTAISVVTPHYGTPLANAFLTAQGHQLLLLLSSLATTSPARAAALATTRSISLLTRMDDWLDRGNGPIDRLSRALLRGISFKRDDPTWTYLEAIASDQGAVIQLTPEASSLFEASVADRAGIDYGCVIAGVPPPREKMHVRALLHPQRVALRALFRTLHGITASPRTQYPCPLPAAATKRRLEKMLGFALNPRSNDGVVPTLSQLRGRVVHAARADHLDVVGHFTLAAENTSDWLPSGAGFTVEAFEALWDSVAGAIAGDDGRRRSPTRAKAR